MKSTNGLSVGMFIHLPDYNNGIGIIDDLWMDAEGNLKVIVKYYHPDGPVYVGPFIMSEINYFLFHPQDIEYCTKLQKEHVEKNKMSTWVSQSS